MRIGKQFDCEEGVTGRFPNFILFTSIEVPFDGQAVTVLY